MHIHINIHIRIHTHALTQGEHHTVVHSSTMWRPRETSHLFKQKHHCRPLLNLHFVPISALATLSPLKYVCRVPLLLRFCRCLCRDETRARPSCLLIAFISREKRMLGLKKRLRNRPGSSRKAFVYPCTWPRMRCQTPRWLNNSGISPSLNSICPTLYIAYICSVYFNFPCTLAPPRLSFCEASARRTLKPSARRALKPSARRTLNPSVRRTLNPSARRALKPSSACSGNAHAAPTLCLASIKLSNRH